MTFEHLAYLDTISKFWGNSNKNGNFVDKNDFFLSTSNRIKKWTVCVSCIHVRDQYSAGNAALWLECRRVHQNCLSFRVLSTTIKLVVIGNTQITNLWWAELWSVLEFVTQVLWIYAVMVLSSSYLKSILFFICKLQNYLKSKAQT